MNPSRISAICITLLSVTLSGCASGYRSGNTTAANVTANQRVSYIQKNNEKPTARTPAPCTAHWSTSPHHPSGLEFIIADGTPDGPGAEEFSQGLDLLSRIAATTPVAERARLLDQARSRFRTAAAKASDEDLRDAATANCAIAAAALGDWSDYRNTSAKLPQRESYPRNLHPLINFLLIPIHITGFVITLGHYGDEDALDAPVNRTRYVPGDLVAPGARMDLVTKEDRVDKVVRAKVLPSFFYADGSEASLSFPDLDVAMAPVIDGLVLRDLQIQFTNKSQRVVAIANMAMRIETGRGQKTDLRSVDAEVRALPQEQVRLSFTTNRNQGAYEWRSLSEGPCTLTVYDVPVQFDHLGNVTRKENITWRFTFTNGRAEETARDDERSVITRSWWEFIPGATLLDRPAN